MSNKAKNNAGADNKEILVQEFEYFLLLLQNLISPPGISSQGRRGLFLLWGCHDFFPPGGVHGEGEVGPNVEGEGLSEL